MQTTDRTSLNCPACGRDLTSSTVTGCQVCSAGETPVLFRSTFVLASAERETTDLAGRPTGDLALAEATERLATIRQRLHDLRAQARTGAIVREIYEMVYWEQVAAQRVAALRAGSVEGNTAEIPAHRPAKAGLGDKIRRLPGVERLRVLLNEE